MEHRMPSSFKLFIYPLLYEGNGTGTLSTTLNLTKTGLLCARFIHPLYIQFFNMQLTVADLSILGDIFSLYLKQTEILASDPAVKAQGSSPLRAGGCHDSYRRSGGRPHPPLSCHCTNVYTTINK